MQGLCITDESDTTSIPATQYHFIPGDKLKLRFRNIITLTLVMGFFAYAAISTLADIFVFGVAPSDSKMAFLLAGALIGFVASVVTFLYEDEKTEE